MPHRFTLAGKPKLSLVHSRTLLARFAPAEELDNLYLGGGTSLTMRWGRWHSTDIDYGMPLPLAKPFVTKHGPSVNAALAALRAQGLIKRQFFFAGRSGAWHYLGSGPVSISAPLEAPDRSGLDREDDTGTPMIPARDVLHGKLMGRTLSGGKLLLVRDGYDLAMAFDRDRDAIESLIRQAWAEQPQAVASVFNAIKGASHRIIIGRPIIDPAEPALARDPWGYFVHEAESVLSQDKTHGDDSNRSIPSP
ncbi:MAG: nucleotidyl transferase AbiEii/AbiGii toxin family protein [Gammaproteobacteria bacterium]|nr:nucleotidyl transferase AbiEii/AbiGii toxin family protein [Gammaproteobacteria bacterium]